MALLKIRTYPDPFLKEKALPVTDFGPEQQTLFDNLIETMFVEDGVGLAAPQAGIGQRVLIAVPTMKRGEEHVIVNPEIYETAGREKGPEGCLSLPNLVGQVYRAKTIKIRYQDRHGQPHDELLRDFFARIIQHELDHLDGILFIDRVDFDQRQKLLAEYKVK